MSEIEDRRQRALEFYHDGTGLASVRVENTIEVATQVKITTEIVDATGLPLLAARAVLEAAFRAAGFEVIE